MEAATVTAAHGDEETRRRNLHDANDPDRVNRLFTLAGRGDEAARNALIERFLPLARTLAARYARKSEPMDDLVQVASVGLVKAVDRFDPGRGLAFSTYAVPTILGELKRHFRDATWAVHVPRSLYERAMTVERAERELANRLGRRPSVAEIADEIHMELEDVLDALEASRAYDALTLDAPTPSEDGQAEPLVATLGSADDRLERVDDLASVAAAMPGLTERQRRVLALRFGEDMTQSQIAEEVGVSQMQVSRILRRTLGELREQVDGASPPSARSAATT